MSLSPEVTQAIDQEIIHFRNHLEQLMNTGDGSLAQPYELRDPSQQLIILRLLEQRAQKQEWINDARGNLECITSLTNKKIHFLHAYASES